MKHRASGAHRTRAYYDRGQDPAARTTKVCLGCGRSYENVMKESPVAWKRKKYCSRDCFKRWYGVRVHHTSCSRWTRVQEIILFEAYRVGGCALAARVLGRSKEAVKHRVKKLRLPPGKGHAVEQARRKAEGMKFWQPAEDPDLDLVGIRKRTAEIRAKKQARGELRLTEGCDYD